MPRLLSRSDPPTPAALRSRVTRWSLAIAWAALVFAVSSVPGSGLPGGYSVQAHFIEYGVLAALLYRALRLHAGRRRAFVLAVVLASCYGITDEIHQAFVPLREPDAVDWLIDTVGAAVGAGAAALLERLRPEGKTGAQ